MGNHLQNILCISSAHIKPETMMRVREGDFEWLSCYRMENPSDTEAVYGAFIHVDSVDLSEDSKHTEDIPEDLLQVLLYADAFRAQWLLLDDDEDEVGELPTYRECWDELLWSNRRG